MKSYTRLNRQCSIFLLFSSDDIIDLIVEKRNLYATRGKKEHKFKTDRDEIKKFISLIIMSGYHSLPSENDYWSTSQDLIAPIFSSTMSRDRFRLIIRYLHIADNSNLTQSKVAKILPLYKRLEENCLRFGFFHQLWLNNIPLPRFTGIDTYNVWFLWCFSVIPYGMTLNCNLVKGNKTRS